MALSMLSGDQQRSVFHRVCNLLDPRDAVAFSSVDRELRASTEALLKQLITDHEAATALCHKVGLRSCKELREAKHVNCFNKGLSATDLTTLGTLGSVLPALESLYLGEHSRAADGMRRLAEVLSAGALPAVTYLSIGHMHVGDAGASALAAALGRGALPRLKTLYLANGAITDAALVALAPALQRLPALEVLVLSNNPFSDEGITALLAPPPPAGAPPPQTGVLTKLYLSGTQITDAGCAALAAAFDSGVLSALEKLGLRGTPASAAAKAAVGRAGLEVDV